MVTGSCVPRERETRTSRSLIFSPLSRKPHALACFVALLRAPGVAGLPLLVPFLAVITVVGGIGTLLAGAVWVFSRGGRAWVQGVVQPVYDKVGREDPEVRVRDLAFPPVLSASLCFHLCCLLLFHVEKPCLAGTRLGRSTVM